MIPINKEELIQQYIDYKVNYYRVNFKDMDKLDRVEKILNCHGWLPEAEETFKFSKLSKISINLTFLYKVVFLKI